MEQAVVKYMARAAEKLRRQHCLAGLAHVYVRTNPFKEDEPQCKRGVTVPLGEPTDDTLLLVRNALAGLRHIYREGYLYQKAGVMLSDLVHKGKRQPTLFDNHEALARSKQLMGSIDAINNRMGSGTVRLLGEGLGKAWKMRRAHLTPHFTTRLDDVAVVKADR